jgi:lysozyme
MPRTDPLVEQLKRHEGFRSHVYLCTAGKKTVGYGRNLDDTGLSKAEAEVLLINDIEAAKGELSVHVPVFVMLSPERKAVLVNMTVNLGITKLLGFKRMLEALRDQYFEQVAAEMLNSKWAQQVGGRAHELAAQMRTGVMREG